MFFESSGASRNRSKAVVKPVEGTILTVAREAADRVCEKVCADTTLEGFFLEYLSELFGINQKEAHRASCDAEANVGVYFALKALKND